MGIHCQHLSKYFSHEEGKLAALKDATFKVEDQEFVSLIGPSGCGKSTLLRMIAGLLTPDKGSIEFGKTSPGNHPHAILIFQDQALFPWLNVIENIAFGLEMQGISKKERLEKSNAILVKYGLEGFSRSYPHQLSGGMRQRVALARAFLSDPEVLLMDEPFGALDAQTRLVLQEELLRIWRDDRKTILFVTHDIEEAIMLSDRILVLTDRPGKIREEITIPLDRPRDLTSRDHPKIKEIKWHIWSMLEEEVRKGIEIGNDEF